MSDIYNHYLFDAETLSTTPDGVILALAVVRFQFETSQSIDEMKSNSLFIKFDAKEQLKAGRKTTKETIEWWKKQTEEAKQIVHPSDQDVSMFDGAKLLFDYIQNEKKEGIMTDDSYLWSRGMNFDFPLLEDLFQQLNIKPNWSPWKYRDVRTMVDVLTGSKKGYINFRDERLDDLIKHNPLDDAIRDVIMMQHIFQSALERD